MHNLKEIRKNFDFFKKSLEGRFVKIDFNQINVTFFRSQFSDLKTSQNADIFFCNYPGLQRREGYI